MCNSDLPYESPASGTRRHQSPVDAADHNPSGIQSKAASQAGGALIALQSGTECAAALSSFFSEPFFQARMNPMTLANCPACTGSMQGDNGR